MCARGMQQLKMKPGRGGYGTITRTDDLTGSIQAGSDSAGLLSFSPIVGAVARIGRHSFRARNTRV